MAKIPERPQRRTIELHYMRFCVEYIFLSFSWQCILGLNDWTFIYPESTSHQSLEKELRLMFPYWNINTYPSKNSWLTYRNTLGASSLVPSNISFSLWITMSFLGPLPEIWARLGDNNIESFRGKRTSSGYCRGRGWTFLDRRESLFVFIGWREGKWSWKSLKYLFLSNSPRDWQSLQVQEQVR